MSAVPYDSHEHAWGPSEPEPVATPRRPRRRLFNRRMAALIAVLTCAAGFYTGVRVEKSQLASTPSAATASAAAPASGARPGAGAAPGSGTGAQASTATGASSPTGFPGAGRFGGGANASLGTISSVSGNTIYLTDTTGNTVKVTLSSATKLTKSLAVSKSSLHPGDSVVIQGVKNSSGTLVATSVSDSGANTTGNRSSSTSAASGG
jgi:hypothetical protein